LTIRIRAVFGALRDNGGGVPRPWLAYEATFATRRKGAGAGRRTMASARVPDVDEAGACWLLAPDMEPCRSRPGRQTGYAQVEEAAAAVLLLRARVSRRAATSEVSRARLLRPGSELPRPLPGPHPGGPPQALSGVLCEALDAAGLKTYGWDRKDGLAVSRACWEAVGIDPSCGRRMPRKSSSPGGLRGGSENEPGASGASDGGGPRRCLLGGPADQGGPGGARRAPGGAARGGGAAGMRAVATPW